MIKYVDLSIAVSVNNNVSEHLSDGVCILSKDRMDRNYNISIINKAY